MDLKPYIKCMDWEIHTINVWISKTYMHIVCIDSWMDSSIRSQHLSLSNVENHLCNAWIQKKSPAALMLVVVQNQIRKLVKSLFNFEENMIECLGLQQYGSRAALLRRLASPNKVGSRKTVEAPPRVDLSLRTFRWWKAFSGYRRGKLWSAHDQIRSGWISHYYA